MERIGKAYTLIGTLFLTTVLFMLAGLFLLDALYPQQPRQPAYSYDLSRYVNYLYSPTFRPEAYYLTDPDDVRQVGRNYDQYALSGHWQVNSWATLGNMEFTSEHLNIDADGVRHTVEPDMRFAKEEPLLIWAFGGSTMFGWGMSDDYTLPSQLQMALQEALPNRYVQVVNFGTPGYTSAQEVALFTAYLRDRDDTPDMVLFLDGLNEVNNIMGRGTNNVLLPEVERAWQAWIAHLTDDSVPPWVSINESLPLFRLFPQELTIRQTSDSDQTAAPTDEVTQKSLFSQVIYYKSIARNVRRVLSKIRDMRDHYLYNIHLAEILAESHGIQPYFFLQPVPAQELVPGEFVFYHFSHFYERVPGLTDSPHFYDISDVLFEIKDEYHAVVDSNHYSDKGNQYLAQHMAEIIVANMVAD